MNPKKGTVATLTPSTPTPDTPRTMRNKARSQSVHTDSTSSTDLPEVFVSRKRAKTAAAPELHTVWKYPWPSFQGKMVIYIPNSLPEETSSPTFWVCVLVLIVRKKSFVNFMLNGPARKLERKFLDVYIYPPVDEMMLMWPVEEV